MPSHQPREYPHGNGPPHEGCPPHGGWPPHGDRSSYEDGRRRPPGWVSVLIPMAVLLIPIAIALHSRQPLAIGTAAVAWLSSLLLLVRRLPGPRLVALAALCTPAIAVVPGPPIAALPLVFGVIGAVFAGSRIWVWGSLAGTALFGGVGWAAITGELSVSIRTLIVVIALSVVVAIAEAARARRERYRTMARDVAARRQTAAEAERLRIARELHDVLAHSLSQITVQAGVGLHLFDADPEQARRALETIKHTSSEALDDVRGVLGMLRADGEAVATSPQPDLSRLNELVATARAAGVDVQLRNSLPGTVRSAVQFVIYRIVQESITNLIRHSAARTASVTLSADAESYRVVVWDPGPATVAEDHEPGAGIIGMRERAASIGGTVTAEDVPGGGFRLSAWIPA